MSPLGTGLLKKMLINDVRSRNVYENKGSMDKVTAKKSDIYGNSTWILQKNSGFEGQLSLIDVFRAGFARIFPVKSYPHGRPPSAAHIPSARGSVKTREDFALSLPHYLEHLGPEAGVFVRLGSTNRRADMAQIAEMIALREAIINAVVHANYAEKGAPIRVAVFDDRIKGENPGTLPFGLTIEDIRRGVSRLRNRVIGRVFHELGLIEQWGSGIQRMTRRLVDCALPHCGALTMSPRVRRPIFVFHVVQTICLYPAPYPWG